MKQIKRKAPEILWLAIAVLSLITAVHKTVNTGFGESWYFFVFVLLAVFMYYVRKSMRKNSE
jgi:hypothetical protein